MPIHVSINGHDLLQPAPVQQGYFASAIRANEEMLSVFTVHAICSFALRSVTLAINVLGRIHHVPRIDTFVNTLPSRVLSLLTSKDLSEVALNILGVAALLFDVPRDLSIIADSFSLIVDLSISLAILSLFALQLLCILALSPLLITADLICPPTSFAIEPHVQKA